MSDSLATAEIISPAEVIKNAKEELRSYANLDPSSKLYPDLTPQQRVAYAEGTLEQREILEKYKHGNPYKPETLISSIGKAKLLLTFAKI